MSVERAPISASTGGARGSLAPPGSRDRKAGLEGIDPDRIDILRRVVEGTVSEMRESLSGRPAHPRRPEMVLHARNAVAAFCTLMVERNRDILAFRKEMIGISQRDVSAVSRLEREREGISRSADSLRAVLGVVTSWFDDDVRLRAALRRRSGDPLAIRAHATISERFGLCEIRRLLESTLDLLESQIVNLESAAKRCREERRKMVLRPFRGALQAYSIMIFAVIATVIEILSIISPGEMNARAIFQGTMGYFTGFQHGVAPLYAGQQIVSPFSHALLHVNPLHLVFNMVMLTMLGAPVLRFLAIMDERRSHKVTSSILFWVVFFSGAALGALATGWFLPAIWMVGASGGVFAIIGLWAGLEYRIRRALELPAGDFRRITVELTILNTAIPVLFILLAPEGSGGIAWQAHLAGFLVGLLAAALFRLDADSSASALYAHEVTQDQGDGSASPASRRLAR